MKYAITVPNTMKPMKHLTSIKDGNAIAASDHAKPPVARPMIADKIEIDIHFGATTKTANNNASDRTNVT